MRGGVVGDGCHGCVEGGAAADLVEVGGGDGAGLDERVDAVDY